MMIFVDIVVNNNVLESMREVWLGKPDTSCSSRSWLKSIWSVNPCCSSWSLNLIYCVLNFFRIINIDMLGLIDVNLESSCFTSISLSWWLWFIWTNNRFWWISSPSINKMLLSLKYFIISKSAQIVDNRMLPNWSLNFNKLILNWRFLFSSIKLFLKLFSLFSSLLFVFIFWHALVAFSTRFSWRGEWTDIFLYNLVRLLTNRLHVDEFIFKDVHKSISKARNNIC